MTIMINNDNGNDNDSNDIYVYVYTYRDYFKSGLYKYALMIIQ